MKTINIELTDTQAAVLEVVSVDPAALLQNFADNRARLEADEIVSVATKHYLDDGIQIPATREAIVQDAFARGWVKTAAVRQAEAEAAAK